MLYADRNMNSMRATIAETERRRAKQETYYAEHCITPQTIIKNVDEVLGSIFGRDYLSAPSLEPEEEELSLAQIAKRIRKFEKKMFAAASGLEFEREKSAAPAIVES